MKSIFSPLFVLVALVAVALPLAAEPGKIAEHRFTARGRERSFHLYVPKKLEATPVPLVILLHGSGRDGLSLVEKWDRLAKKEGFLVVGPTAFDPEHWQAPLDGPGMLYDLVEHLKESHPIDPRRVYLFGHSAGAFFGIQMALLESQYFAAAAVHAGFLPPDSSWLLDKAKRKIPIFLISGTDDRLVPISGVQHTHATLAEEGFPAEIDAMKEHDHWYYDLAPKINKNAWEFLSRHALEEEPVYEEHLLR